MPDNQEALDIIETYSENDNVTFSVNVLRDGGNSNLRKVRINILDKTTGEAIEEVDVLTSADSVLFANGNDLPAELDNRFLYSNTKETTATIGGVPAGTAFYKTPYKEIFDLLFFPYMAPSVSITSSLTDKYLEMGTSVSSITFNITIARGSESITGISLYKDNVKVATITDTGNSISYTFTESFNTDSTFQVRITDKNGTYVSESFTYIFNNPIYIGTIAEGATISEAVIKGLNKVFNYNPSDLTASYSLTCDEKCFIVAYTKDVVSVLDKNGFDITDSFSTKGDINLTFTGKTGYTLYKYAISNLTTQSNFKLTFNF